MADKYWAKRLVNVKDDKEHLDTTPLTIPIDCKQPETTNDAIARIMFQSGQIDLDAYHAMRGMEYDMPYDDAEDFDIPDYEDEMVQSVFAKYEDEESTPVVAPKSNEGTPPPVTEGNKDASAAPEKSEDTSPSIE